MSDTTVWKSAGGLDEFLEKHKNTYDAHISQSESELTCVNQSLSKWTSWITAPWQWFGRQLDYQNISNKNREGIQAIRGLIEDKYDKHAIRRFDEHFNYRSYWGKPLTLRALRNFVVEEDKLRENTLNLHQIETTEQEKEKAIDDNEVVKKRTLETFKSQLAPRKDQSEDKVIIGYLQPLSENKLADKQPVFTFGFREAFLQIKESFFVSEDQRQGRSDGIKEARKMILSCLEKEETKDKVDKLFEVRFADKINKSEPLKINELLTFVDETIEIRDKESGLLGWLHNTMQGALEKASEGEEAIKEFVKTAYHDSANAARAAMVLQQTANAGDPITLALKATFTGVVVEEENDIEALLTACMLHYTKGTSEQQSSWSANITKSFLSGGIL